MSYENDMAEALSAQRKRLCAETDKLYLEVERLQKIVERAVDVITRLDKAEAVKFIDDEYRRMA